MAGFSTLPTLLLYKIDFGGEDADVHASLSYHPHFVPDVLSVDEENLVFRWAFKIQSGLCEAESGLPPNWVKVHLFAPRPSDQKPPPPPVGESTGGFTLRGVNRQLEESDLWLNYVNPYYVRAEGVEVVAHSYEDLADDRENVSWPGKRSSHKSFFVGDQFSAPSATGGPADWITVEEIPLRVSAIVEQTPRVLLIVTEIKRTKRLKLNAYQFEVQLVQPEDRRSVIERLSSGELTLKEAREIHGIRFESFREQVAQTSKQSRYLSPSH